MNEISAYLSQKMNNISPRHILFTTYQVTWTEEIANLKKFTNRHIIFRVVDEVLILILQFEIIDRFLDHDESIELFWYHLSINQRYKICDNLICSVDRRISRKCWAIFFILRWSQRVELVWMRKLRIKYLSRAPTMCNGVRRTSREKMNEIIDDFIKID